MVQWFWCFFLYSFFGFLLEVVFARLTRNPKRDRKCRYLLPLCPVYGLGAMTILLLPEGIQRHPLLLFLCAALSCTAVEYLTGLFYEKAARVSFWDYSHLPLNLNGRVCPLFSLFWGALALGLLHVAHPMVLRLTAEIPAWLFPPMLLLFLADMALTLHILRREQSTDALRWYDQLRRRTA